MRILLVNDDGIHSPGLMALKDALSGHEIWVAAPDSERSGASHSLTLSEAVRTREIDPQTFAVRGTPVDCVLIALQHMLANLPDIVISGINIGANAGADIIYSGTAAGARQAAILGIPGVAVSHNTFTPPLHLGTAQRFIKANVDAFVSLWQESADRTFFLNINVPNVESFDGSVVCAPPAKLTYENSITSFSSPGDEVYHFYSGTGRIGLDKTVDTDIAMLDRGNIVLSPVKVYPELAESTGLYRNHSFKPA